MKYSIPSTFYLVVIFQTMALAHAPVDTVPQTQAIGHHSHTWDSFKKANPAYNIPYVAPPAASVTGDANLTFPIKLPEARQGHKPELAVQYSVENGSTWLGTGWNLSLPSITLDTRWGVPTYDPDTESEIYLYNGEQLGPVFHRAATYDRAADRVFQLRQQTQFLSITRHGNSTTNYWWEVRATDGSVSYYGGTPATGSSSSHVLTTTAGHIAEWHLMEQRDVYDNVISYTYDLVTFQGGKAMYPAEIRYNGHGNSEGAYHVNFTLRDRAQLLRQDVVVNCRSGLQYTMADLLAEITVSYDGQQIRAYRFVYEEGAWLKQLLTAIEEYDAEGILFYEYTFDYHDDVRNAEGIYELFGDTIPWSVPNDNVDVNPITATSVADFLESPTLLGGAKSWNIGSSFAVTFGLNDGNLVSKMNTVGPNGGVSTSNGTGVTALVDINGDGLPDKVWKEDGSLYYRANLHDPITKQRAFSPIKHRIDGVTDFSISNTITTNIGAEINVGVATVGGFVGYSHERNTTNTSSYFADFNGDELIDIANDGTIYFNRLNADGHPVFQPSSSGTPSPIGAGMPIDGDQITTDGNQDSIRNAENPLHDAVRIWTAVKSGTISIMGSIALLQDNNPSTADLPNKDGVFVTIQRNSVELWRTYLPAGDYTTVIPTGVGSIQVSKDDSLYFRVHAVNNGYSDQVAWDPIVTYTNQDLEERDANGLRNNRYQASEDFMTNANRGVILPYEGTIRVSGMLQKPELTDTIYLSIRGGAQLDTALTPKSLVDGTFTIGTAPIEANGNITCHISCKSNVDWAKIDWQPIVTYESRTDGGAIVDETGDPIVSLCPSVDKEIYNFVQSWAEPYVADNSGRVTVEMKTLGFWSILYPDMEGHLTVKSSADVDSVWHSISLSEITDNVVKVDVNVEAGDSLFVDLTHEWPGRSASGLISETTAVMNGDSTALQAGHQIRNTNSDLSLGAFYRGWGQFVYKANGPQDPLPILTSAITVDEDEAASDTLLVDEGSTPGEAGNTMFDNGEAFLVMRSDPKSSAWRGSDSLTYITATKMSASRNGMQDISDTPATPHSGTDREAVTLQTKSYSDAVAGGVSGASLGVGGGVTPGHARSIIDIADMNGDRYPDILFENSIQYTNFSGGLSDRVHRHGWGSHGSSSFAKGGGVGGSYASTSSKNSGSSMGQGSNKVTSRVRSRSGRTQKGSTNAHKTSKGSIGISANFTFDDDWATHTFMDINGDGLEDKVWEGGDVAMNLGYEFAPKQSLGFDTIRAGTAFDLGGGLGFTFDNKSITAGVSLARTTNYSEKGFTDVNNDALVDEIVSINPMVVRLNTGRGFSAPMMVDSTAEMDAGVSIGESINGAGTVCFPIFIFKLCFNVAPSAGGGTSSVAKSFVDVDGDGFVDLLSAKGNDGNLIVRSSNVGRTNLLKSYYTPLGGSINLDYELVGNTADLPFSKWVLSSVVVHDGIAGDGVDTFRKAITYSTPYYDRHERHFYGFAEVQEAETDTIGRVLRAVRSTYHVSDSYRKGLLRSQSIIEDDDRILQTTTYDYVLTDIETGDPLPLDYWSTDDGTAFPALKTKTVLITEGDSLLTLRRIYLYDYDTYGNILSEVDIDEASSSRKVVRTYDYRPDIYMMDKEKTTQYYGDDILYRQTEYLRDDKGNPLETHEKIDDSTWAITVRTFDPYGNVLTRVNPENHKGEKLDFQYQYDDKEHQYVTVEKDGYGYERKYQHENLHNTLEYYTDENNNTTTYVVDASGRPLQVTYAREANAGQPYSLQYEYAVDGKNSYGKVKHYDEAVQGELITYEFVDGIFRSVQTKYSSHVYEDGQESIKYIVSGTDSYDDLGRKVASYQPLTEPLSAGAVINSDTSTVDPVRIVYDALDRPLSVTDPLGEVTTYSYGLANDVSGQRCLTTTIVNPRGHTKTQYFNTRGDIVSVRSDGPSGDIWTQYRYDGHGQVVDIIDTYGNETHYTYDLLGRRLSVKVPDAGITILQYDPAGNLLSKITETIREEINVDGAIRYNYYKERLVQIDYPKNFQNKVQIHYGSPQDSFNRANRIWLQEDATGGREYFFDENGNRTKTIRTVMINRSEIYTYVSEAEYDSWGRILSQTYPDGEYVTYTYHEGGKLQSITGVKGGDEQQIIVHLAYDKFGDLTTAEYGNGSKDSYQYDDKRRLQQRKTTLTSGTTLSEETYTYDEADNLRTRSNSKNGDPTVGGTLEETYQYDLLNRLYQAEGSWQGSEDKSYSLLLDYDDIDNLDFKQQISSNAALVDSSALLLLDYDYDYEDQPTRPSTVSDLRHQYDGNGNLLLAATREEWVDSLGLHFDQNVFDEENRIMGTSVDGYISRYTYDAFGRRAVKSHGESQVAFVNGAAAGFVEHTENYKATVDPYFVVYRDHYRKHYYVDQLRVLTKVGTGVFQTSLAQGPAITAGGIDYKSRIHQYENSILDYYGSLGVPPGPPGLLAMLGQPEFNGITLPDATASNPYNTTPPNWPNLTPPDTLGPPGIPVFFEDAGLTRDNVTAGYNFTAGNIAKEVEHFYYHYDHTGSTQYITNYIGNPRQYAAYYPTGQRWIHQQLPLEYSQYTSNIMWQGLDLDLETGMYAMGHVYYDPVSSVAQNIDPVLLHFGETTFLQRQEGLLYYNYAVARDNDEDETFDIQILNSEKPSPLTAGSINKIEKVDAEKVTPLKYKDIENAFGGKPGWEATADDIVDRSGPYSETIAELAPHLALVDITDDAQLEKLKRKILVTNKVNKLKQRLKKYFGSKQTKTAKPPKTVKTSRRVRFK